MKQKHALIMGKNCLLEVLRVAPERILEVFTLPTTTRDSLYQELLRQRIPIKHCNKHELSQLVQSTSHQNFIASVRERSYLNLHRFFDEVVEREICLSLMLDSIFDPHNFGAILRAAECFGTQGVVYSKNRGTQLTPVVSKVSSGASELVPLLRVSNLAETARLFHEQGFTLVTADVGKGAVSLYDLSFPPKMLLILGSEAEGVQKLLKKKSDILVKIPMEGKIDSLNVSQAAAVFLNSYRKQFPKKL